MKITSTICRILLGALFTLAGLSGLYFLTHSIPPAPAGLANDFQQVFFASHWVFFIDAVEFIGGVLLLANRYVPLALTLLAGVIFNILVYHLMIQPSGLPLAIGVAIVWAVVASRHRRTFAPLLRATSPE